MSSRWKFSAEPIARPPETTTRAAVSSGRSDFAISAPTKEDTPGSAAPAPPRSRPIPSAATGSKEAARTVITFFASDDFTVASALPA